MKEMKSHLEMLRVQIAECERLQKAEKSPIKRDVFARLLVRYRAIAAELEQAIAKLLPAPDALLGRKSKEPSPEKEQE
ncbi:MULTISPECIES: hypothetical protein [unclassified Bradyrhizobium]|uniref:hypothetical protein n=1 Tax=unclassified Bradyrhizobium TaxID=2631580 RepID=UPI0024784D23|nr:MULTISPECIES: hypothetical protein [unclassified Bradyrhizobium]WGR67913.1 hypothetical protein MTX24_20840 [Bradyrhizobium sp. ISRA426]WGR79966.1 hypothetical protein MTX21_05955 [Bradyrhizobium sp. ISRA430]WGR83152.1 hypothetical protein MTX25_20520 [Bradyrhizobium sp. ISRA432]